MRHKILTLVIFFLGAIQAFAAGDANWSKGNTFYQQKQYDSAAYYYEQVAAQKPADATVYYNLGNAYYRLNNIPYAVLNYQRALRIRPDYKEAKDNLLLAQSRITNRVQPVGDIFFVNWWRALTDGTKATFWAVLSLVLFIAAIAILLLKRLRKGISVPGQVTGILLAFWMVTIILAYVAAGNSTAHTSGVVLYGDSPLMNDGLKGKPQSLVPAGTTVEIKDEKADWMQVRLPDGRTGWMQQAAVTKI